MAQEVGRNRSLPAVPVHLAKPPVLPFHCGRCHKLKHFRLGKTMGIGAALFMLGILALMSWNEGFRKAAVMLMGAVVALLLITAISIAYRQEIEYKEREIAARREAEGPLPVPTPVLQPPTAKAALKAKPDLAKDRRGFSVEYIRDRLEPAPEPALNPNATFEQDAADFWKRRGSTIITVFRNSTRYNYVGYTSAKRWYAAALPTSAPYDKPGWIVEEAYGCLAGRRFRPIIIARHGIWPASLVEVDEGRGDVEMKTPAGAEDAADDYAAAHCPH